MRMTRRDRVDAIIKVLEDQLRTLEALGLAESASLLRVIWLDLKCRNGGVSPEELEAFCACVSNALPISPLRARSSRRGRR